MGTSAASVFIQACSSCGDPLENTPWGLSNGFPRQDYALEFRMPPPIFRVQGPSPPVPARTIAQPPSFPVFERRVTAPQVPAGCMHRLAAVQEQLYPLSFGSDIIASRIVTFFHRRAFF